MVKVFLRNSNDGKSIEKIFCLLYEVYTEVNLHKMSVESKGIINRILLCSEAFFKSSRINHVSGDILFITPFLRNKKIVTFHDFIRYKELKGLRKFLYKYLMILIPYYFADKVTVVSKYTLSELELILGKQSKKSIVVYNPLTLNPNIKSTERNTGKITSALFLGSKSNKNLHGAINALKYTNIKLTVIGKMSENDISFSRESNITVIQKSNITEEELIACYRNCDFLLFPSFEEGFGLPIIEAQFLKRPVITSNVGCMPEIGGQNAAIYVNPYDIKSIHDGIKKLDDADIYKSLVDSGRKNINRFKLETIRNNYLNLYQTLIN